MTKRARQLYHFGVVCGLVKGITKQLMQDMECPIAKCATWHIERLSENYPTDIKTKRERTMLIRGYKHGKHLREILIASGEIKEIC